MKTMRTFLTALVVAALCSAAAGRVMASPMSSPEVSVTAKAKPTRSGHSRSLPTSRLNVNLAGEEELAKVPGLGRVRAAAIVTFRADHKLESLEDLSKVKGIGPKTLSKVRPWLVTDGPVEQPLAKNGT